MSRTQITASILFSGFLFLIPNFLPAGDLIRIGGDSAPPYRILGGSQPTGLYVEIINSVLSALHLKASYENMPMARALSSMEYGDIDMMLGPIKTPEREEFMNYLVEIPLPRENKVIFIRPDSMNINSRRDLYSLLLGVLRGAVYSEDFNLDTSFRKYEVTDYSKGLKMVELGRLDGIIIPERQGSYLIRELKITLKKSTFNIPGLESYITISKKSPIVNLIPQIVSTYKDLRKSGVIDKIIETYNR